MSTADVQNNDVGKEISEQEAAKGPLFVYAGTRRREHPGLSRCAADRSDLLGGSPAGNSWTRLSHL